MVRVKILLKLNGFEILESMPGNFVAANWHTTSDKPVFLF